MDSDQVTRYLLETRDFLINSDIPKQMLQTGSKLPSDKQMIRELGLTTLELREAYNTLKFVLLPA